VGERFDNSEAQGIPARMIDKRVATIAEAMDGIKDGSVVLLGGFGVVGQPQELLEGLLLQGARDLTMVSNNAGAGSVTASGTCSMNAVDADR